MKLRNKKRKTVMRPFDLERALDGDPVVTREGNKVTIVRKLHNNPEFPVMGIIDNGYKEYVSIYTSEGREMHGIESPNDLFMASTKHEGWINIYPSPMSGLGPYHVSGIIYNSEEEAKKDTHYNGSVTIKIEWEE